MSGDDAPKTSSMEQIAVDKQHGRMVKKAKKQSDPDRNPCGKEQAMSYRCLDVNGYDRDLCSKEFQNYRNCMKFWHAVMIDRKKKGIKPAMPPEDERAKVKEEYRQWLGF